MKIFSLIFLILFSLPVFCASDAQSKTGDCVDIIKNRCETCHYSTRICQQLGEKSKRKWKSTIKTMKIRGALLSPDEEQILLECLSKPGPEIKTFCQKP